MPIEDRFPDFSPTSGAVVNPGTRHERVTFSDSADLSFRCRYYKCSAAGTLKVTDAYGVTGTILVVAGYNMERLDRIWATDSDAITVDIWD